MITYPFLSPFLIKEAHSHYKSYHSLRSWRRIWMFVINIFCKAMRSGKRFGFSSNFAKLYRECRKLKGEYFGTFWQSVESRKSVDGWHLSKIPVCFWHFQPFLEAYLTDLVKLGHFVDQKCQKLYRNFWQMSKILKITVNFWHFWNFGYNDRQFSTWTVDFENFGWYNFAKFYTVKVAIIFGRFLTVNNCQLLTITK